MAGLIFDAVDDLYRYGGAYSGGTVFELTPLYPRAVCSHSVLGEVDVLPAEKRDVLERSAIERP